MVRQQHVAAIHQVGSVVVMLVASKVISQHTNDVNFK